MKHRMKNFNNSIRHEVRELGVTFTVRMNSNPHGNQLMDLYLSII